MVAAEMVLPSERLTSLLDPSTYRDGRAEDTMRYLRKHHPVARHVDPTDDGDTFVAVTGYAACAEVLRSHNVFTNAVYGRVDGRLTGGTVFETYPPDHMFGARSMLQHLDLPRHAQFKRIVAAQFRQQQIEPLEQRIRAIVRDAIAQVQGDGRADFVSDIALRVPLPVICEMFGMPSEGGDRAGRLMGAVFGLVDDASAEVSETEQFRAQLPDSVEELGAEFRAYVLEVAEQKRRQPEDDLMSLIANATVDGERLDDDELCELTNGILGAGFDTILGGVSLGLAQLLLHSEQLDAVVRDPALLNGAIEEMLRFDPPVLVQRRNARERLDLFGTTVHPDDKVVVFLNSANRDEAEFPNADAFDITRAPNRHLGFSHGLHRCLGAWLAKVEMRIMLEETLGALRGLALDGPIERVDKAPWLAGVKRLPIRFEAVARDA